MRKRWVIGGLIVGGLAAAAARRRLMRRGYQHDEIDSAGAGATFGERDAAAPEQAWAPAETRHDVTAEELSMAARVEASMEAIRNVWPSVSVDDIRSAEGDLDRLARLIGEQVDQPPSQVRERLDAILARETPEPSYPAH